MKNGRVNERNTGNVTLDGSPKQRRQRTQKITENELQAAKSVIEKVIDCMEYDKELSDCGHLSPNAKYTDGGRFVLTLTREQLELLYEFTYKIDN